MNTSSQRRIAAHFLYYRRTFIRNAIVSLSSDGIVTEVAQYDRVDAQPGVEFYNGILIPELVNAHCHLELSYMKGMIRQGGGFTGFARSMGQMRGEATQDQRLAAATHADELMWRSGVGAVGDICNGATTFGIKKNSHIIYTSFAELFGLNEQSTASLHTVVDQAVAADLTVAVTPHSVYSLNDAAFRSAVEVSNSRLPLSIHFMESPVEGELFAGKGEMHDWYVERGMKTDFIHYGSPARRVTQCVPSDRDIMLIHNCCVTEEDIEIIQDHFTGRVTWVLCPRSNEYISGLRPPVALFRRKGVNIAVGTDSLASNMSLDMAAEMKMFAGVPLEEVLWWATGSGAEALNIKGVVGELEVGDRSGIVLLEGIDWNAMSLTADSRTRRIV